MSESQKETNRVARSTGVVGLWTLVSRVLGALRDIVVANIFGATAVADAFFVAQTIPNVFRRLVGEGAVSAVLVPTYAERLAQEGQEGAKRYARALLGIWFLIVVAVVLLGIACAPFLVSLFAFGFRDNPQIYELTVRLTRWMFPYLGLVSLVGFYGGIANAHRRFAAAAATPVVFNVCVIAGAVLPMTFLPHPIYGLAVGVVCGGVVQLTVIGTDVAVSRCGMLPAWAPKERGLSEAGRLMIPQLFGIAVYQINIVVLRTYASMLPEGSVTQYYNATRVQELTLGLFAVALATASQPSLSRFRAIGDHRGFSELFRNSMGSLILVSCGAAVGMALLSKSIVVVLFGHGEFSREAVDRTADVLFWLSLGLIPAAGVRMVNQVFFALKNTKRPVQAGVWALFFNALAGGVLAYYFGVSGLAAGLSIATFVQFVVLLFWLRRSLESWVYPALTASFFRSVAVTMLMGLPIYWLRQDFGWERTSWLAVIKLTVFIGVGLASFFMACRSLAIPEFQMVVEAIPNPARLLRRLLRQWRRNRS
ncbi:MAG: murein biosynthesis integral membrane protein MurJ [Myxococcales bacterium]|nr:murein biosynthesis integral membrane protein MurJ [Myxococcales bacterium]